MIRKCGLDDREGIYAVIDDAARAYKGVIPADRWKEPYMPMEELIEEIAAGIEFWGFDENDELVGVMGIQPLKDVTLIRHAYVRTSAQRRGIGRRLLRHLRRQTTQRLLIGTWADATWAIRFYQQNGFHLVAPDVKDKLLRLYWAIPERQIETSVVLSD